jgi:hypothetical protein
VTVSVEDELEDDELDDELDDDELEDELDDDELDDELDDDELEDELDDDELAVLGVVELDSSFLMARISRIFSSG